MLPAAASLPYGDKIALLEERLGRLPGAVVAFSGGVDSTMLLHACCAQLGERAVAVTADSPSLPRAELVEAHELFVTVAQRRAEIGPETWPVVFGAIVDDLGDHRPGQRAAAEHGVLAPLI